MCREKTSRKNITYLELKLHISFLMLWNEEARNTYYCCYYQNEEQFVISTNGALFRMTQGRFWAILHIWTARPWTSWNRRNKETWVSLLAIPHKYIPIGIRANKFISYNHIKKNVPKEKENIICRTTNFMQAGRYTFRIWLHSVPTGLVCKNNSPPVFTGPVDIVLY